jgi:hypothetical protein
LRRLRRQEVPRRSRLGKTLGLVFAVLVLVLAAGVTFAIGWRRARALTARKFGSTPARLARGEHLVRDVTNCMACHAEHDWTAHDAPILPNTPGAGQGMNFLKGLPGKVYAPNTTPDPETGVGNWSDDQLARAIREGVSHDGRALFPFMPYPDFRSMSDEDLASVIRSSGRQPLPNRVTSELILPQWATANRERQGSLTESRTTIAGDPFYRE